VVVNERPVITLILLVLITAHGHFLIIMLVWRAAYSRKVSVRERHETKIGWFEGQIPERRGRKTSRNWIKTQQQFGRVQAELGK